MESTLKRTQPYFHLTLLKYYLMITQFQIKNFRSIKAQTIPVKKLNILYGPNGSGKSSVLYAPYVMRNFFVNPNQRIDSLFNLGFINLGGFDNVQRDKDNDRIILSLVTDGISKWQKKNNFVKYQLALDGDPIGNSEIEFSYNDISRKMPIDIPFTNIKHKEFKLQRSTLQWNGLTFDLENDDPALPYEVDTNALNELYEQIKLLELISVKRGFFSPIFSSEFNPDEANLALQVREGLDFELKIDKYFHSIFDKHFRFVAIPGSTSFYLRTHTKSGRATDLVNEGFGVNQTIYMLIKLLKKNTGLAMIEEPEIHLHPTAQSKLVDAFCDIVQKENKQIFLTTHSENIVSSVLRKIADGEIDKNDVQFLLAKNENDETVVIPQEVNDKGQIEGGLMNFMETELNNLKTILGI